MRRIGKRRIAFLRKLAEVGQVTLISHGQGLCHNEFIALLDAYERMPDEVVEGYKNFTEPTLFLDDNDEQQLVAVLEPFPANDQDVHVRVEVYYLNGARG